ncbi:hypothetical protein [Pelagicoccus mobilis]|uniref:Uncharacterized protein n=1 Tax=Pelagicoccus mobilis TaxID=415221 RepID=A0A934RVG7_9BACT|nr:hypothetical protein [Pelagicoccus mobilis]MBK1877211.1 hypothetical protein [Pelagicoccus mobilis]
MKLNTIQPKNRVHRDCHGVWDSENLFDFEMLTIVVANDEEREIFFPFGYTGKLFFKFAELHE